MVKVDKLAFPADFYVLDMRSDVDAIPVLLGRPFLRTAGTKIDVPNCSLTMEFGGTIVKFEINKPASLATNVHSLCVVDVVSNHVSKSRKFPLPSKVFKLQDSPSKLRKCIVLWNRREDAVKHGDKVKARLKEWRRKENIKDDTFILHMSANKCSMSTVRRSKVRRVGDLCVGAFDND